MRATEQKAADEVLAQLKNLIERYNVRFTSRFSLEEKEITENNSVNKENLDEEQKFVLKKSFLGLNNSIENLRNDQSTKTLGVLDKMFDSRVMMDVLGDIDCLKPSFKKPSRFNFFKKLWTEDSDIIQYTAFRNAVNFLEIINSTYELGLPTGYFESFCKKIDTDADTQRDAIVFSTVSAYDGL